MKFATYLSTPGLDRFSSREQFNVYCRAHKQVMQDDQEYRRTVQRFRHSLLVRGLLGTLLLVAASFGFIFLFPAIAQRPVFVAVSIGLLLAVVLADVLYTVRASFRMQEFQNERIARLLRAQAGDEAGD